MALGLKRIETRDWATSYHGPLAIHASKGGMSLTATLETCIQEPFFSTLVLCSESFREAVKPYIYSSGQPAGTIPAKAMKDAFPYRGSVLAVVTLRNCRATELILHGGISMEEKAFGNYGPQRFGWITDDVKRLEEPLPFKSGQRLIDPPEAVKQEIWSRLK
jgi:hypothetical protein